MTEGLREGEGGGSLKAAEQIPSCSVLALAICSNLHRGYGSQHPQGWLWITGGIHTGVEGGAGDGVVGGAGFNFKSIFVSLLGISAIIDMM